MIRILSVLAATALADDGEIESMLDQIHNIEHELEALAGEGSAPAPSPPAPVTSPPPVVSAPPPVPVPPPVIEEEAPAPAPVKAATTGADGVQYDEYGDPIPTPAPPPPPKPPVKATGTHTDSGCQWSVYLDHDIAHHDLGSRAPALHPKAKMVKVAKACRQFCLDYGPECAGFSYFKAGRKCELKGKVKSKEVLIEGGGHDTWILETPSCRGKTEL